VTTPSEALRRFGSDKVTDHSYGPVYDSLFGPGRPAVRALLEVGVYRGAGLCGWAEAFPAATVYGIDLTLPEGGLTDRCRVIRADATDPSSVARAVHALGIGPLSLDAVIDDASHVFRDQIATLLLLWDYVRPGGAYVIEDVQSSSPPAPYVRLGGAVHDLRHVRDRHDDVLVIFHKSG
jgi:hypothetical protein